MLAPCRAAYSSSVSFVYVYICDFRSRRPRRKPKAIGSKACLLSVPLCPCAPVFSPGAFALVPGQFKMYLHASSSSSDRSKIYYLLLLISHYCIIATVYFTASSRKGPMSLQLRGRTTKPSKSQSGYRLHDLLYKHEKETHISWTYEYRTYRNAAGYLSIIPYGTTSIGSLLVQ